MIERVPALAWRWLCAVHGTTCPSDNPLRCAPRCITGSGPRRLIAAVPKVFHAIVAALRQHATAVQAQDAGGLLLNTMLVDVRGTSASREPTGPQSLSGSDLPATCADALGGVPRVFETLVHVARMTTGRTAVAPTSAVTVLAIMARNSALGRATDSHEQPCPPFR